MASTSFGKRNHDQMTAAYMPIVQIAATGGVSIKAKCSSKTTIKTFGQKGGKLFSCTMVDDSGSIKLTFFDKADIHHALIMEEQEYVVESAMAKLANPQYNTSPHLYELSGNHYTTIRLASAVKAEPMDVPVANTPKPLVLVPELKEFADSDEWPQGQLRLLQKLVMDAKHLAEVKTLPSKFVLKLADRQLFHWKKDDFHPLLLCDCNKPIPTRCSYYEEKQKFGCSNWSSSASKKYEADAAMAKKSGRPEPPKPYCDKKLYERDVKKILNRICALIGRPNAVRQYFLPTAVRFAQHVGFGLVHHTPPLVDEKKWRLYDTLFDLRSRPMEIDEKQIKTWNDMGDVKPNPCLFDGFEAPEAVKHAVRSAVALLTNQSIGPYKLIHDSVLPYHSPMSEPEETIIYQECMDTLDEDTLVVINTSFSNQLTLEYDYTFIIGRHTTTVKILTTWANETIVAVPLHGMGKCDLGWLYGFSELVVFAFGEKCLMMNTRNLQRAAVQLGKTLPLLEFRKPKPTLKPSVDMQDLLASRIVPDTRVYTSDSHHHEETHEELCCGPACLSPEAADTMRREYTEPGSLDHIPLPTDSLPYYKTSVSNGEAHDVFLIFSPISFLQWASHLHQSYSTI